MEATGERASTSTGADTTGTTMATEASADATAMRMKKNGLADIGRIATDTDHNLVPGHHTDVPTIETATSADTDLVVTEIAAHLANAHLVEVATMMTGKSIANPTPVLSVRARQDRNQGHPTGPGVMSTAGIRGDDHLPMNVVVAVQMLADQNHAVRHLKRPNVPRRRSKLNVRSVLQLCSQTHQS